MNQRNRNARLLTGGLVGAPSGTVGRRGVGSVDGGSPPITNAADFDDTADYMHWTPASDGDLLKWTLSFWGKQSGGRWVMWGAGTAVSDLVYLDLLSDYFSVVWIDNSGGTQKLRTSATFPMTSWTHVVVSLDAANATTSERVKIYMNGTEITSFIQDNRSTLSASSTLSANANDRHTICASSFDLSKSANYDGTLADFHFIDGQVLTASDFGEDVSGTWSAKEYTGTYGSNGYHLDFTDGASLGTDSSGNGNDWTEVSLTTSNQVAVTTSDIPQVIPAATGTLRTRGYLGAAAAGRGMLTLYDRYIDNLT